LVLIPGTSKGDFLLFLKIMEKVSPPLLLITTSSLLAILRTSARRCLASAAIQTVASPPDAEPGDPCKPAIEPLF
jgi:hypothetical protein